MDCFRYSLFFIYDCYYCCYGFCNRFYCRANTWLKLLGRCCCYHNCCRCTEFPFGARLIERFETYGTIALYIGYIIFAIIVISNNHQNISQVFATGDTSFVPNTTAPAILWSGVLYCAYNLVVVPSSFFTIKDRPKTSESIISGIIGGILMTIPWFFNLLCCNVCFYPNEDVLAASVPWLSMMQGVAGPVVLVYLVLLWVGHSLKHLQVLF